MDIVQRVVKFLLWGKKRKELLKALCQRSKLKKKKIECKYHFCNMSSTIN
jgi:hypothetical protein